MCKIYLYGTIGTDFWDDDATTAADFAKTLDKYNGKDVDIYINSSGGNVFDAYAMYSAIKRYPGKVTAHIDGLAASAASYCALSADEVIISPSALIMIHNAWTCVQGNAADLRSSAEILDKLDKDIIDIYHTKTGLEKDVIIEMMKAETWLGAEESIEHGFADSFGEPLKIAAHINPKIFKYFHNVPCKLLKREEEIKNSNSCNADEIVTTEGTEEASESVKDTAFTVISGKVYKI